MTTETLYRLRIPFELLLVAFAMFLAWLGVRRSE
jgi:hypothetical protein